MGALKEPLVYLWIRRGVDQSQSDCGAVSIIWPPHVAFNDFTVKDVTVMSLLLFPQLSWQPQMKTL